LSVEAGGSSAGSRIYFGLACFALFTAAAAASFNGFYDKHKFSEVGVANPGTGFTFEAMVDGTASRPFVYRQLVPAMANWTSASIDAALPETTRNWLYRGNQGRPVGERFLDSPIAGNPAYLLRYCAMYGIVFGFTLASVYLIFGLCNGIGYSPPASALTAIGMILIIPFLLTGGGYYYDYPELAFMVLAVWMALKCDWWWILPVAALATWNKESFLLFVPALYPLLRQKASRKSAIVATTVLELVCAAVYYALRIRFENNPGGSVEIHAADQIRFLVHIGALFSSFEKTYGLLAPRVIYIPVLALIGWTALRGWRHLPRYFKRHALIAMAINVPLYFIFCQPGELRDLSMLYVTLIVLLAANLNEWAGLRTVETGAK
jgi:hypothetical protein